MFDGDRFRARLTECGLSQSELARRVGVSQASIYRLASGGAYGSKHLHRIARELGTTPAYLTGETDDPDANAPPPPPPPTVQHVMMAVALPSQPALARMFEGLLMALPEGVPQAEHARLLARWLPIGLAQLRDLLPHDPTPSGPIAYPAAAHPPASGKAPDEVLATHDRELR